MFRRMFFAFIETKHKILQYSVKEALGSLLELLAYEEGRESYVYFKNANEIT